MSLNHREIALILSELPLQGSHIQDVRQPDFRSLVLELHRPGETRTLFFNLSAGGSRLHALSRKPPKPKVTQRFAEFLRARIRGGRIVEARQVPDDRTVLLVILRGGEETRLWVRLWGAASNIIAADGDGLILDAYFRRPGRGEESGGRLPPVPRGDGPPEALPGADSGTPPMPGDPGREYPVRPHPPEKSFNAFIEEWYRDKEDEARRRSLQALLEARFNAWEAKLHGALKGLELRRNEYSGLEKFLRYGDLITANLHRIGKGDLWLEVEDYGDGGTEVQVKLDPAASPQQNAEAYYRRYKKAKSGLRIVEEDILRLGRELRSLEDLRRNLARESDLQKLEEAAREEKPEKGKAGDRALPPGLQFHSQGFRILVGRTAAENDELLRRHVRGNDFWLHTRDHAGGYVFITHKPGKSVPLETLLDAGNLAVFYSKARSSGKAELYYTRVKHLRRARGGKTGTVLPTHEKNLSVRMDRARLERLQNER